MKRTLLLATLLLSGCSSIHSTGPFGREVPAPPDALDCATREMGRLGYTLVSSAVDSRVVQGEKDLYTRTPRSRARLTAVQVEGTTHETRLRVSAERWEQRGGSATGAGFPGVAQPNPGIPRPGVHDSTYARTRTQPGWRRVGAGPAGADAQQVIRACTFSGSASSAE
jgi:hypothetical protein